MSCRRYFTTGVGLLVGAAIALNPLPATARICTAYSPTPASRQLREFRVESFDVTLMIPDNYRSMLRSGGHITFHDPGTFELIQCLVRTGEYAEVPPYAALEVHRGINPQADLVQSVRLKRPWLDFYNPEYEIIEINGQVGLKYDYRHEIYPLTITNISFIANDGMTLLTLTGPADNPIVRSTLSTLTADEAEVSNELDAIDELLDELDESQP